MLGLKVELKFLRVLIFESKKKLLVFSLVVGFGEGTEKDFF